MVYGGSQGTGRVEAAVRVADEPDAVANYLAELCRRHFRPAFLRVDGILRACSGPLALYGLGALTIGAPIVDQLPLLYDLLPLPPASEPLVLPWMKSEAGGYMDVHILPGDGSDYVIFLEALPDGQAHVAMLQSRNELALQQHKQVRLLSAHVGQYVAERLLGGGFSIREEGERREAALLFCDIRGFSAFSEENPPQVVFQTLNRLLQAMVQPILELGGWLDKIAGDAVYAAFGLTPLLSGKDNLPAPLQALLAGQKILADVRAVNDERRRDRLSPLGVGIGITTGAVAVGLLGTKERRQFAVIGHHVNLASRLQGLAQAGEIIIDLPTYAALGERSGGFLPRPQRLRGMRQDVLSYVLPAEP
jgi:class 3 adenylate cyclase